MSDRLFDALETCLQAIELGETLDAALSRFPALAADLGPILDASLHARTLGGEAIPSEIKRRGRIRLLQAAAKMRDAKRSPRRTWLFNFRPLAVTLVLVVVLFSSTGLVRASSGTLPGDNLYPVKRTWEDVRLVFAFNPQERETLELKYETERQDEISELLTEGRAEPVTFSGYVTAQTDGEWNISGIPVTISSETVLPVEPVTVGSAVTVFGSTTPAGVQANSITIVPAGVPIPTLEPEDENNSNDGGDGEDSGGDSGSETGSAASSNDDAGGSRDDSTSGKDSKLEGTVQSMDGNIWIINGQSVNVSRAEIVGVPAAGASVIIEGYFNADGMFVATKVIFGSGDNSSSSGSDGSDDHSGSGGGGEDPPGGDD